MDKNVKNETAAPKAAEPFATACPYAKKGYELKKAQPVDMFPGTKYVEVVSLLQKMSNTRERTITLDVEMEDYHRIKNRTEVTADATE